MSDKKVLIITYYWPPAGGPGVQRWLKFVKYLPQYTIEPVVFCPKNPSYPINDSSLENDVPKGIEIIKFPIKEPYKWARLFSKQSTKTISAGLIPDKKKQSLTQKLLLFIRGNFFIPDARKSWVTPSASFLSTYLKTHAIDTVITTGPPHSVHLIGLQLKQHLGNIRWIADFRDPWTTIGYHKNLKLTKTSACKHNALELEVLNTSDHIITTSYHTKQEFASKTKVPISVITNGYDVHSIRVSQKDTAFTIAHIGSLLSERNPTVLWESLKELIAENTAFADALQLNLVGLVSDSVLQSINDYGLQEQLHVVGYVTHNEAIHYQLKSQVLLLVEINSEDTKAIIPGKLFEYMTSNTPILAIGPKNSDVESIINRTETGGYFYYSQKDAIKQQLLEYFEAFKRNEGSITPNVEILKQYSREALTKQLSTIIRNGM